ncbi:hypothetical protein FBU30_010106 [Linnemannia zychae]|nr:hypothetical protein FBU30_010106 [Linnemannia zychae]
MERSNQQSSDTSSTAKATAMRASVQNPHGTNYEVAGPMIGGTATPYNRENIEIAKEHLADSVEKISLQDKDQHRPSAEALRETVVSGAATAAHTAGEVGKTVAAGVGAAGAATVTAVKNFFAEKTEKATTTTTTTNNRTHPIADFPRTEVHNIREDQDSTLSTPTVTHTTAGPIVEPIHSTGLDSFQTRSADPYVSSGYSSKLNAHPTSTLNQEYTNRYSYPNTATANPDIARYASSQSHTTTTNPSINSTHDTVPSSTAAKVAAPVVGATSFLGNKASQLGHKAAELGTEAKGAIKDTTNNLTHSTTTSDISRSTSSSYDTIDSNKAIYNPSISSPTTSYTTQSTSTPHNAINTTSSAPLTQKATAPVIGAASSDNNAASNTTSTLGNKLSNIGQKATELGSESKGAVKKNVNNLTSSTTHPSTTAAATSAATTEESVEFPSTTTTTYYDNTTSRPVVNSEEPYIWTTVTSLDPTTKQEEIVSKTVTPVAEPHVIASPKINTHHTNATAAAPMVKNNTVSNEETIKATTSDNYAKTSNNASEIQKTTQSTTSTEKPAAYRGSIPQCGPGEEVVWVKTITTTDYYDDGTPAGRADVVDRRQETINPRDFATVKDGQTVLNNNQPQPQSHQRGTGQHK